MPCDSIQTSTVDIGKVDPVLFDLTMKELGIVNYRLQNGKLVVRSSSGIDEAVVKREYSRQVVFSQAKRFGWQLKPDPKNANRWEVIRR